jgi:hypothetical protein
MQRLKRCYGFKGHYRHFDRSHEGKSRLADSDIGLELDTLEFDYSS